MNLKDVRAIRNLKIISAKCVGGYNDTTIYNVTINYYGKNETVTLEKSYHDMQEPSNKWKVFSTIEPVFKFFNLIRTKAGPFPGLTC